MSAPGIVLYSAQVCPFAHRTRLVLTEKGLDFDVVEIDIDAEETSPELLRVSPYGRVPALVHRDRQIYESSIINVYLDEAFPQPALLPLDIGQRAQMRIWLDFFDNHFLADWYAAIKNQESERLESFIHRTDTLFQKLEKGFASLSGGGPYWLGRQATLLDFAIYPFFERIPAWTYYRGVELPERCRQLRQWFQTMLKRPSVQAQSEAPEFYIRGYEVYARHRLAS